MADHRMEALYHVAPITSRQNAKVVELSKLSERKHRKAAKKFRFDGVKLAREALRWRLPIRSIFLMESQAERLLSDLLPNEQTLLDRPEIILVEDSLFSRISEESAPEGIICVSDEIPMHGDNLSAMALRENDGVVLLESVRDPSNLGAIIRSAAAFGVELLILSEDCADIYNPKTVRASMGSLFGQRIVRIPHIKDAIAALQQSGRRVFAAALDRQALQLGGFAHRAGDCVVIGNEGHGLSPETIQACDACVFIPMTDRAESLNAAVAASVLMWQFSAAASSFGDEPRGQA